MKQSKLLQVWDRYKFALLILLVGVALLLLPDRDAKASERSEPAAETVSAQQEAEAAEARLASILSEIEGAGRVRVLLSFRTSAETEYVSDGDETVIVSTGSGRQSAVTRRTIYPQYQGAVIVCDGGDSPQVRLNILQAVSQVTGLGTDQISVLKLRAGAQ